MENFWSAPPPRQEGEASDAPPVAEDAPNVIDVLAIRPRRPLASGPISQAPCTGDASSAIVAVTVLVDPGEGTPRTCSTDQAT